MLWPALEAEDGSAASSSVAEFDMDQRDLDDVWKAGTRNYLEPTSTMLDRLLSRI